MSSKAAPRTVPPEAAPDDLIGFVAQRLGQKTADLIQHEFGGRAIYLGVEPEDHHVLPKLIGVENAKIIALEFGSGMVDIPLGPSSRRARIEQACLDGQTITNIAREFGCCTRTVSKTRARLRRQGRL
jgi:hypothetical protein